MTQLAKTHILFPKPLLRDIDKAVGTGFRSAFVIEAALEKLNRLRFQKALRASAGCWTIERHPSSKDQKGINRYLKNVRASSHRRLPHG